MFWRRTSKCMILFLEALREWLSTLINPKDYFSINIPCMGQYQCCHFLESFPRLHESESKIQKTLTIARVREETVSLYYGHTFRNKSRQIGSFVYSTAVLSSDERLM